MCEVLPNSIWQALHDEVLATELLLIDQYKYKYGEGPGLISSAMFGVILVALTDSIMGRHNLVCCY